MMQALAGPLVCPDCGTQIYGVDAAACSLGHVELKLYKWPLCKCGHGSHYDMSGFCIAKDCECERYDEGEGWRQITRRPV